MDFYTESKTELLADIQKGINQPYSYVVTPNNVDHLIQQHDKVLRKAYTKARLKLCDSRILQPVMHSLEVDSEAAIPSSDLTLDLLRRANNECLRLVIIDISKENYVQ